MSNKIFMNCISEVMPCLPEENNPDKKLSKKELEEELGIDYPRFVEVGPTAIFKEGTWNGHEYERSDILEMVTNYHKMKKTWTPTLKISHEQGMHLADTEHSEEANGRVTEMWEKDGTIYANFEFERWFYAHTIAEKKLNHKSVEIWPEMEYDGVKYNNVISNVALLGISMPGCGDLGEIENEDSTYRLYKASKPKVEVKVFEFNSEEGNCNMQDLEKLENAENTDVEVEEEINTPEEAEANVDDAPESNDTPEIEEESEVETETELDDEAAPEVEVEEEIVEPVVEEPEVFTFDKNTYAAHLAKMKSDIANEFKAELDSKNTIIDNYKKERRETKINHDVEDLIKGGHVTPAHREVIKELFGVLSVSNKINFEFGEKTIDNASTLFNSFLKTYSAWQSESATENDDIETEVKESLPAVDIEQTITYAGSKVKATGMLEDKAAKDLQKKYKLEGIEKSFIECYEEIVEGK